MKEYNNLISFSFIVILLYPPVTTVQYSLLSPHINYTRTQSDLGKHDIFIETFVYYMQIVIEKLKWSSRVYSSIYSNFYINILSILYVNRSINNLNIHSCIVSTLQLNNSFSLRIFLIYIFFFLFYFQIENEIDFDIGGAGNNSTVWWNCECLGWYIQQIFTRNAGEYGGLRWKW